MQINILQYISIPWWFHSLGIYESYKYNQWQSIEKYCVSEMKLYNNCTNRHLRNSMAHMWWTNVYGPAQDCRPIVISWVHYSLSSTHAFKHVTSYTRYASIVVSDTRIVVCFSLVAPRRSTTSVPWSALVAQTILLLVREGQHR